MYKTQHFKKLECNKVDSNFQSEVDTESVLKMNDSCHTFIYNPKQ